MEEDIDRPLCIVCQKNLGEKRVKSKRTYYNNKCESCRRTPEEKARRYERKSEREKKRRATRPERKSSCERCGFVPEHACQLDVDHIDGNRYNNDQSNLMTLCANCHRLKTWQNGDWDKNKYLALDKEVPVPLH